MNKYIVLILIVVILFNFIFDINSDRSNIEYKEKRAIFISYIELSKYIKNNDIKASKNNIKKMINNIDKLGFNMIILQVRSFSDAIYKSNIYPWSNSISSVEGENPGYDILEYFIKKAKLKNISIYAWINPYRIRTTEDISSVSSINPAFKFINTDTLYINNGIFYNPAKDEVINLIVDGVEEIVKNYDVEGVLFDDYFYPSNDIDNNDYSAYIKENGYISRDEYHLLNVNRMIEHVHRVCRKYNKLFGISPDGNIENNYNKNFADVKRWCKSREYIDFIMPQIYYGFYNEAKAFKKVIEEWESLITSNIDLMIALAFYKVGLVDKYAKNGSNEWINNNDIIMREIILSRNLKHYKGFSLFRYDYLFNDDLKNDNTVKEMENMKKVLK
ncbi:MAG: hypothetical protein E7160_05120 [Firmicutes bacterium]|nr:hypothetical protein [Bacillota bacterium]